MALDVDAARAKATGALKGFSVSQLVIIGLLGVVAVVGAVSFLRWVTAPTYSVLLAGLESKDAAAVTEKLSEDGVPYKLESGGSVVLVPREVLDQQRLAVASAGLPAGKTDSSWAAFDEQGLTSSSFQQQVAYQRALEATLAETLVGIDGVREATVHLSLPEKKVFTEEQQQPRASVLLQTSGELEDGAVDAVTRLVSSSVPGLAPGDVSVSDGNGRLLTGEASGRTREKAQAELEDGLTARATSMLDTLLGPGRAVVRVSVELENATRSTDSETFDRDRSVVLDETATEETYEAPPPVEGGVVGDPANPQLQGQGSYSKTQSSRTLGVSRTVTRAEEAAGGIKRLTVAVAVDRNARNAPNIADLEALVGNAVGLDARRGDAIAVSRPSFLMPEEEKPVEEETGGLASSAAKHGPAILGGLLLLLVTVGLVRTVRRGTSKEVTAEQLDAALASAAGAHALPAGDAPLAIPAPRSAESQVGQLVDENPEEVAALLRGWLVNSGSDR